MYKPSYQQTYMYTSFIQTFLNQKIKVTKMNDKNYFMRREILKL